MSITPNIVAQVQSTTTAPGGTEVQVEVVGPSFTPSFVRNIRARGRALISVGVVPTTVDTIENLPMGEIDRLTRQRGDPVREQRGKGMEATLHTVIVNRD